MTSAPQSRHLEEAVVPDVRCEPYAVLDDGTPVERWTFGSDNGVSASVITLGAALHALHAPDRDGVRANVVLGTDDLPTLLGPARFHGATIGRFANRIGGALLLDGTEYPLATTGPDITLHGGTCGFADRVWTAREIREPERVGVLLTLHSPDGEQGFPGAVDVSVRYTLDAAGALAIEYHATTDRPTVINLTNHAYFNLAGEGVGDILGHELTVDADHYTPVDHRQLPEKGPLEPVAGTPFDFVAPRPVGERIAADDPQVRAAEGYDHNWVLRPRPADGAPARAALLRDPRADAPSRCSPRTGHAGLHGQPVQGRDHRLRRCALRRVRRDRAGDPALPRLP